MAHLLSIIDIQTLEAFDARVLSASSGQTFVVDFWAAWCGPCKALGPILEASVAPFSEKATLVKVNVDDAADLAAQYGVRSIPAVKAFRDGQQIGEFIGALPENQVRKIVAEWIPSEADDLTAAAERLLSESRGGAIKREEAELLLRQALKSNTSHGQAAALLAELLLQRGQPDDAAVLVSGVRMDSPRYELAQNILARVEFARRCQKVGGRSACALGFAENEDDLGARYDLACCMAADGDYELALEQWLESVRRDRGHNDGASRKAMLAILEAMGRDDPTAAKYRRELSHILFS